MIKENQTPRGTNPYDALIDKNSEFYRAWAAQANRLEEPIETALPSIVYAHAKRDIVMQSREPIARHELQGIMSRLSSEQQISHAVHDFRERGQIPDADVVIPTKLHDREAEYLLIANFKPKAIGFFTVVNPERPLEPVDFPIEYDAGVAAGFVSGHIWSALKSVTPNKIENYPELQEVQSIGWNELYPKLCELEDHRLNSKLKPKVPSHFDLDKRVALMGVGYYLFEKKIRVFGDADNPTIRLVRDDEWPKQIVTNDDLKEKITITSGKIVSALQDAPTAMPISWVIQRKELDPQLAYMALGFAVKQGMISVTGEGKELIAKLNVR